MGKVKGNKQELVATTATTTTPLKTINGKVHKVRVRAKNLKYQIKHNENESLTKPIYTEDLTNLNKSGSTIRTCFVKLRRVKPSIGSENNNNTLQVQCRVNDEKLTIEDTILISSPKSRNNARQNVDENIESRTEKCTIDIIDNEKKVKKGDKNKTAINNIRPMRRSVRNKTKTLPDNNKNNDIPTSTTKCLVRIKRISKTSGDDEHTKTTLEAVDLNPSESQTGVPVIDKIKRNNFRKLSLNLSKNGKVKTTSEITSKKQSHTTNDKSTTNDTESQTSKLTPNYLEGTNIVQTKIKLLKNLSLKRKKPVENNNLEITQFEPHQNSTICFVPERNSTLIEFDFTNDKNKQKIITVENKTEQEKEKETEKSNNSNNNSSSHNFANKSQEIEDLLDSLNDDDVVADTENNTTNNKTGNVQDIITKISPISNKTNRFFHRQDKNVLKELEVNVQKKCPSKTKSSLLKSRRKTKSSSSANRDNIYEFLSQSQTSDSDSNKHVDPAADIIKKLIAQGKVRVATNCKGRPVIKRKARKKQVAKKVKLTATKKVKKDNHKNIEVDDHHSDNDEHFIDNFDLDEPPPEVNNNNNMEQQHQDPRVKRFDNNNHQHHISDQEGTFSRLARSVLINQAGRSDLQRQNAQRLLEMAKKFVSTPKNKKISLPHEALHSNLSPIAMPSSRPAGNASPWRVDEDAHLPRVFNFNRSSGNLPSFSSDFIPSTPRKEKPKKKSMPQSPLPEFDHQSSIPPLTPLPLNENCIADPPPQATNEQSILSSFSSNDSNAENMPPPPKPNHVNCNDNDNIFDLKQYPNPKRTLNYRSPLKAINILEVVHLSPYKHPGKTPHANGLEKEKEMFGFEEDLNDDSLEVERNNNGLTTPQENHRKKSKTIPTEDLFGFEDFLTQSDLSSQELRDGVETINRNNKSIHDKLQDLRKLRPDENELHFIVLKEQTKRSPLKPMALFVDGAADDAVVVDGMRQRGIKEMLCSTMIHSPQASTSKAALEQLKQRNVRDAQKPNFVEDSNISELFKDPEPEVTFNENDAHRTYIRPYKRKRRLRENKFVMFLESDESGDEENSAEYKKHHHSHGTDTSSEKSPKKKRKRKEAKEKPEMKEFVHDFNEMCKEVDSYELIVEKSS